MRVTPGQEQQFRAWQRTVTAAEATFPGFQGSKLEPPIPGVQDDWTCIVRFDSDEHLQAWLKSPQRQRLLDEGKAFSPDFHIRTVRGGFEGWFTFGGAAAAAPAWKQNMIVLLVLYPVVFLFGRWVQTPLLEQAWGLPFWLALFIGNAVSVALLGYLLVPQASRALMWWLTPATDAPKWITAAGTALVIALYGVSLLVFSLFA
jgi:antibiotic biosynthesis monooxygenase (ABM) superfamily enzyme